MIDSVPRKAFSLVPRNTSSEMSTKTRTTRKERDHKRANIDVNNNSKSIWTTDELAEVAQRMNDAEESSHFMSHGFPPSPRKMKNTKQKNDVVVKPDNEDHNDNDASDIDHENEKRNVILENSVQIETEDEEDLEIEKERAENKHEKESDDDDGACSSKTADRKHEVKESFIKKANKKIYPGQPPTASTITTATTATTACAKIMDHLGNQTQPITININIHNYQHEK